MKIKYGEQILNLVRSKRLRFTEFGISFFKKSPNSFSDVLQAILLVFRKIYNYKVGHE